MPTQNSSNLNALKYPTKFIVNIYDPLNYEVAQPKHSARLNATLKLKIHIETNTQGCLNDKLLSVVVVKNQYYYKTRSAFAEPQKPLYT